MKNQWEITTKRWGDDKIIWRMKWTNRSPSPISIRPKCSKNKRPGELRTATTKILEQRDDGARMSALANVMRGLNASTHSTLLSFFFLSGSQRMIQCHKMYDYFTQMFFTKSRFQIVLYEIKSSRRSALAHPKWRLHAISLPVPEVPKRASGDRYLAAATEWEASPKYNKLPTASLYGNWFDGLFPVFFRRRLPGLSGRSFGRQSCMWNHRNILRM